MAGPPDHLQYDDGIAEDFDEADEEARIHKDKFDEIWNQIPKWQSLENYYTELDSPTTRGPKQKIREQDPVSVH
eukprot:scaffold169220_cov58-Attheya_sp.AAC.1